MKQNTTKTRILTALHLSPMTADKLSTVLTLKLPTTRSVIPELRSQGAIRIVGATQYRKNRPCNVYALTKLGETMARDWV